MWTSIYWPFFPICWIKHPILKRLKLYKYIYANNPGTVFYNLESETHEINQKPNTTAQMITENFKVELSSDHENEQESSKSMSNSSGSIENEAEYSESNSSGYTSSEDDEDNSNWEECDDEWLKK